MKITRRIFLILYVTAAAWTLWPIVCVAVTNCIAALFHCRLSEGGPLPCRAFGTDISRQMYVGALSFWYALVTLPTGVPIFLFVALVRALLGLVRAFKRRKRDSEGSM